MIHRSPARRERSGHGQEIALFLPVMREPARGTLRMQSRGNPKKGTEPEGIGDILSRTLGRDFGKLRRFNERIALKWREVAGAEIASRTAVIGFRRKVLRVRVESSALLAELDGIYKRDLIAALAEGEDPVAVRTIEFKLVGAAGDGY